MRDARSLAPTPPGLALGTAQGVVKRVTTDDPLNKSEWEVVALRDGDSVVGAVELPHGAGDLVFVTSDAQLLRFAADRVRPQGRSAAGWPASASRRAPGSCTSALSTSPCPTASGPAWS